MALVAKPLYTQSQQMWDSPPLPLNSYNILLRLTDFDNLQKRAVNSLFETAGELKTNIDTESTV